MLNPHLEQPICGAISSNLLQLPNKERNSSYLRHCATVGVKPHPARFPEKVPSFFIEFLTDPGDTVLDIFAASNTTGTAADWDFMVVVSWPRKTGASGKPHGVAQLTEKGFRRTNGPERR